METAEFARTCYEGLGDGEPYSLAIKRIVNNSSLSFAQMAACVYTFGKIAGDTEARFRVLVSFERLLDSDSSEALF